MTIRISKKKKIVFIVAIVLFCFFLFSSTSFALNDEEIENILSRCPKFFESNNWFLDGCRWVGWNLAMGLKWLADECQQLYLVSFGLIDFTTYSDLEKWIVYLKAVYTVIMAVSILGLGIILIVNHEKKPKIFISLLLASLTISSSSYILTILNEGVSAFGKEIAGNGNMASEIINDNFYDLLYIDKTKGLETINESSEYLTSCKYPPGSVDFTMIDINDIINYKDSHLSEEGKEIMKKKLVYYPGYDDEIMIHDVYNGFGWNTEESEDFFNEFYYRYRVTYFPIFLTLLGVCLVYICMSYKVVRIILEIAVSRMLAMLYSANLTGQQKTIKILLAIKDSYIVLLLTAVLIKIYHLGQIYINNKVGMDHPVIYTFLFLFLSFSIIDGPNIIQQLTGIDAGLSSGVGKMIAGYHMFKGTTAVASAPYRMYRNHQSMQSQRKTAESVKNMGENETHIDGGDNNKKDVPPSQNSSNSSKSGNKREQVDLNNQSNNDMYQNNNSDSQINNQETEKQGFENNDLNHETEGLNNGNNDSIEKDIDSGKPIGQDEFGDTPDLKTMEQRMSDMVDLSNDRMQEIGAEKMYEDWEKNQNHMENLIGSSGLNPTPPSKIDNDNPWGSVGKENNGHPTLRTQSDFVTNEPWDKEKPSEKKGNYSND